jgi:hypothetical protein
MDINLAKNINTVFNISGVGKGAEFISLSGASQFFIKQNNLTNITTQEFEEKIQGVKTSVTYRKALEELNILVDNVKNSTVSAAKKVKLQYNLWVLRNKLEEKNPTSKPQSVRNDLSQTYKSCTGFNQLNCKSESIKKVQECLGLEPTGNFDNLMYNKLGNYGWQNGFNDSDVNRVCDLIKKTIEMNIQIEKQKKEVEDFYRKFPKTSRGSEILDLS